MVSDSERIDELKEVLQELKGKLEGKEIMGEEDRKKYILALDDVVAELKRGKKRSADHCILRDQLAIIQDQFGRDIEHLKNQHIENEKEKVKMQTKIDYLIKSNNQKESLVILRELIQLFNRCETVPIIQAQKYKGWGDYTNKYYEKKQKCNNDPKVMASIIDPINSKLPKGIDIVELMKICKTANSSVHYDTDTTTEQIAFLNKCKQFDFHDEESKKIARILIECLEKGQNSNGKK